MNHRRQSAISIAVGGATMAVTQVVLGIVWPFWLRLTARGQGVEFIEPPIPILSFIVSGAVGGWAAAGLAPRRPGLHAVLAALLVVSTVLLAFGLPDADWRDRADTATRAGLLWFGAWLGALAQSRRRSRPPILLRGGVPGHTDGPPVPPHDRAI